MAVERSLAQVPGIEVVRLDAHLPGAVERVARLEPSVVMIERGSGRSDLALAILGLGIPLIELDVHQKRATALAGHELPVGDVGDLVLLIEHLVSHQQAVQSAPIRKGES
jgi:hypothetical protein